MKFGLKHTSAVVLTLCVGFTFVGHAASYGKPEKQKQQKHDESAPAETAVFPVPVVTDGNMFKQIVNSGEQCVPGSMSLACVNSWTARFEADWLQESGECFKYARVVGPPAVPSTFPPIVPSVVSAKQLPTVTPMAASSNFEGSQTNNLYGVKPSYDFSFLLALSRQYGHGHDVELDWMHYNDTNTSSVGNTTNGVLLVKNPVLITRAVGTIAVPPANFLESAPIYWDHVSSSVKSDVDRVDAEFGQSFNVQNGLVVRFFVGAEIAHLKTRQIISAGGLTNSASQLQVRAINGGTGNPNPNDPLRGISGGEPSLSPMSSVSQTYTSEFNGIGPEAGIGFNYHAYRMISLVGKVGAGLMLGTLKATQHLAFNNPIANFAKPGINKPQSFANTLTDNNRKVVPSFDGNLAVRYSASVGDGAAEIDAGWRFETYLNAQRMGITDTGDCAESLNGPFVGVGWTGDLPVPGTRAAQLS